MGFQEEILAFGEAVPLRMADMDAFRLEGIVLNGGDDLRISSADCGEEDVQ
jgi:hypothetical protein